MDLPVTHTAALATADAGPLILAVPKGRILTELGPVFGRAGITPAQDLIDEDSRRLRFESSDPGLDMVRVRPFDVATFVAFGAAQIGICGADVLMEFDYDQIYAPLDLGIGQVPGLGRRAGGDRGPRRCQPLVAGDGRHQVPEHRPAPLRRARRAGGDRAR